jgi:flagellar motor switch protein FliN
MSTEDKKLEDAIDELDAVSLEKIDQEKKQEQKQERKTKADNLDFILDIPLRVSVELGRTKMLVNELLKLGHGSVIELSKLAGEPMEIYVNDKLIARGEVVVVNEKFGVRLTDIISPQERIEQLK